MTEDPQPTEEREAPKRPRVSRWAIFRSVGSTVLSLAVVGGLAAAGVALFHPETPLPNEWNPMAPLTVADPVSPLTGWKLRSALRDPAQCIATLAEASNAQQRAPVDASENCHIRTRVAIDQVSQTTNLNPPVSETSCATALRLAMWEHHGVQPAARELLGTEVAAIRQIGSYNCRRIRTSSGASTRWSTHATADAIDITGFDTTDGRRIRLISDWQGADAEARFLHAVRDSACTWFATTLGPDYNALHADHFHLQARGWGACR